MARMMTPSGTPRPMPILAEVLRPPDAGVGEVECVVDKPDVEEAGKGEACRDEVVVMEEEAFRDEDVVIGKEIGVLEIVGMMVASTRERPLSDTTVTDPPSPVVSVPEVLIYRRV